MHDHFDYININIKISKLNYLTLPQPISITLYANNPGEGF